MESCHRLHARHKHTRSALQYTHTSHTAERVTIQTENTTSITPLTQTYNILQHSKPKTTIFNNGRYTTNIQKNAQSLQPQPSYSGPSIWVKHHKDGGIKGWSRSHVLLISESDMHMLSRSTSRSWCYTRSVSQ